MNGRETYNLIQLENDELDLFAHALSSEARIKRQQRDFLERGKPSIEGERIKTLYSDINLEKIMEKELRDFIKSILDLKISDEKMRALDARTKQQELDKFYADFKEFQDQERLHFIVSDMFKSYNKLLQELLNTWQEFLKELQEKMERLKEQYKIFIREEVHPILDQMRNDLLRDYQRQPPIPDAEIDYTRFFDVFFQKTKDVLDEEVFLTPNQFDDRIWGDQPYKKGVFREAMDQEGALLSDREKQIIRADLRAKFGNHAGLYNAISSLAEKQQEILYIQPMHDVAKRKTEHLLADLEKMNHSSQGVPSMGQGELKEQYKTLQEKTHALTHATRQSKGLMRKMRDFMEVLKSPRVEQRSEQKTQAVAINVEDDMKGLGPIPRKF